MSLLPAELSDLAVRARAAAQEIGLDFPEVIFELVDPDELNMVAAYGGFPVRYPHWRFGMTFQHLQKSHEYGLSRIYELVINTDPCYAYLMRTNTIMEQKLVMVHVYGHADFFRNNRRFAPTDRRMADTMANHATRVRRHVDRVGAEAVEEFLDACLSLENLIDPMSLYVRRPRDDDAADRAPPSDTDSADPAERSERALRPVAPDADEPRRFPSEHRYMDPYLNPQEAIAKERAERKEAVRLRGTSLVHPTRDVLGYLLHHAPLTDWQADCLDIVREEAYYFAPQGMTKIANEGWASFIHSKLMRHRMLASSEMTEYCDKHSGTVSMPAGGFNPYAVGLAIFRDIEDRWNRGAHGRAWRELADPQARRAYDNGAGDGWRKCLEVRRSCDDAMLVDAYLTADVMDDLKLYIWGRDPRTGQKVILDKDPATVRRALLRELVNGGQPVIDLLDANHGNRGELRLVHRHEGVPLRDDLAKETLKALHRLWTRPVHIETVADEKRVLWSFDGQTHSVRDLGKVGVARV